MMNQAEKIQKNSHYKTPIPVREEKLSIKAKEEKESLDSLN